MTISLKNRIVIVGALLLLFGIGIGFWLGVNYAPRVKSFPSEDVVAVSQDTNSKQTWVGEFQVTRVIDGDTIEIVGGERVRYIGMDTPETVDPERPVECFGPEATQRNKELVAGKTVRLEKDQTDRDKYGRLLRYVYVGETLIGVELVEEGFARAQAFPPDTKYQNLLNTAQSAAQQSHLGLWSACPAE